MSVISCSQCHKGIKRGGFPVWTIIVSIVLFPVGLLSLLVGRKVVACPFCGEINRS